MTSKDNPVRIDVRRLPAFGSALALAVILPGCSGLGASSTLTCQLPDGSRCASVSSTYDESSRGELPGQGKRIQTLGTSVTSSGSERRPEGTFLQPDPRLVELGMPVRTQSRVMRMWIKTWEDSEGDLHDQSFVYMPISEGRWMVDHRQRELRNAFSPSRQASTVSSRGEASPGSSVDASKQLNQLPPAAGASAPTSQSMRDALQRKQGELSERKPSTTDGATNGS